jgi:hypothetical protein
MPAPRRLDELERQQRRFLVYLSLILDDDPTFATLSF